MPNYAVNGLIVRGEVVEASTYARKRDNAQMLGLRVRVEGEDYKEVHEVSLPVEGSVIPAKGAQVEVECACRVTREGQQYLTGYAGGLQVLSEAPLSVAGRSRAAS